MYSNQEVKLYYTEIPYFVRQYFQQTFGTKASREDLDYFSHDIMTCSFLGRDHAGYYRFYHKSFLEFFVAERMYKELKLSSGDSMSFAHLSDEVSDFLAELVDIGDGKAQLRLCELIKGACTGTHTPEDSKTVVRASNAIGVLSRIQDALEKANLTGINLSNARLASATNMEGACLSKSTISKSSFANCNITMSDVVGAHWETVECSRIIGKNMRFRDTIISNASFKRANLKGTVFSNVVFHSCDFGGADLSSCIFEKCKGSRLIFSECNLCGAKISSSAFDYSVFRKVDFTKATLASSMFTRGDFRYSTAADIVINDCRFTKCKLSRGISNVLKSA